MSFGHRGFSELHDTGKRRKLELHLEELKAPIEVHFADGVPHLTTL
jgi:hypothetical protein